MRNYRSHAANSASPTIQPVVAITRVRVRACGSLACAIVYYNKRALYMYTCMVMVQNCRTRLEPRTPQFHAQIDRRVPSPLTLGTISAWVRVCVCRSVGRSHVHGFVIFIQHTHARTHAPPNSNLNTTHSGRTLRATHDNHRAPWHILGRRGVPSTSLRGACDVFPSASGERTHCRRRPASRGSS